MVERIGNTRVCRCCGIEREINNFDLGGNRKPIHVCRKCRYAQQTISNLRDVPTDKLSDKQRARFEDAQSWLDKCREATGYVTSSRRSVSRVDFTNEQDIAAMNAAAAKKHSERVARAQALRAANPDTAVKLSRELLESCTATEIAEAGFTFAEVDAWIQNNIDKNDPIYDQLVDKAFHIS